MPVELIEQELRDAIAVAGERGSDAVRAVESALAWMGWEGEGPLLLRRYEVQMFAWYTLPLRFPTSLGDKREVLRALAGTLERLGGRAAGYADVCRADETEQLLRAWEAEDSSAGRRLQEMLYASGIEPPDTDLLAWGQTMGLQEASVREQVSSALEEAIEDGRLTVGTRGFRRRQARLADAALGEPRPQNDGRTGLQVVRAERLERWLDRGRARRSIGQGNDARTRLQAVHAERVERWLFRGLARRSIERRQILGPVAGLLAGEPPVVDEQAARVALAPVLWLLERAGEGIALTQTGALNRALVRESAERWPRFWNELLGIPHRQVDVPLLCELDRLLCGAGLVRRAARRMLMSARGRELAGEPPALLRALAGQLLAGEGFRAACAELAVALILDGCAAGYSGRPASQILPAIIEDGWRAGGEPPPLEEVRGQVAALLRSGEAIGIFERRAAPSPLRADLLALTTVGYAALTAALRARALAPGVGAAS